MPPKSKKKSRQLDDDFSLDSSFPGHDLVDTLSGIQVAMERIGKPIPQPKPFSLLSGIDFEVWLFGFRLYADGFQLVGEDRKLHLISLLEGDVAKIARNIPSGVSDFEAALIDRIKPSLSRREYRSLFKNRFQKENENARIFADSLLCLARKAFCDFDSNDIVLDHFIEHVRLPAGISRSSLFHKQFNSFEEAVEYVQSWELADRVEKNVSVSSVLETDNRQLNVQSSHFESRLEAVEKAIADCCAVVKSSQRCFKCRKMGHLANECSQKVVKCFKCGKLGHIARFCRSNALKGGETVRKGDASLKG